MASTRHRTRCLCAIEWRVDEVTSSDVHLLREGWGVHKVPIS